MTQAIEHPQGSGIIGLRRPAHQGPTPPYLVNESKRSLKVYSDAIAVLPGWRPCHTPPQWHLDAIAESKVRNAAVVKAQTDYQQRREALRIEAEGQYKETYQAHVAKAKEQTPDTREHHDNTVMDIAGMDKNQLSDLFAARGWPKFDKRKGVEAIREHARELAFKDGNAPPQGE